MAHILVIAEERLARQMAWILGEAGHAVEVANDAQAGLRDAGGRYDVIVTNGVVPASEMPEFLKQLTDQAPQARVVDVAASPDEAALADAHLEQPFHADELVTEVERLLRDPLR
jgi:DNA-binding NtrC family response regulator